MLNSGSLTFEKGDDYTQTTLVHPLRQEEYTQLFNASVHRNVDDKHTEIIRICRDTYTRLYHKVNNTERKLRVLSTLVSNLGDLPFANIQTIQRLQKNAATNRHLSGIVRSQCAASSFVDERHLLLTCINEYLNHLNPIVVKDNILNITFNGTTGELHATEYTLTYPDKSTRRVRFYIVYFKSPTDLPSSCQWRQNTTHRFVLSAVDVEDKKDTISRIDLMGHYIPIGILGQKPYEYVHQAERMRTVDQNALNRAAPEKGEEYRFIGDLTSALWPNNDWSLFDKNHSRRDLCSYSAEERKHILSIARRVLKQPEWLNIVMGKER